MDDNTYIIIHICILAVTFPKSPLELSSSPLPGWGPGLAYLLWGCQMVASPPVLTNNIPFSKPTKTGPTDLFSWEQNLGPLPLLYTFLP